MKFHSKSEIRRINSQVRGSQEDLQRELESYDRSRKARKLMQAADLSCEGEGIAQCLLGIIDANGVKATTALEALSRYCALQTPGACTPEQASSAVIEFNNLMAEACGLEQEECSDEV